MAKKRECWCSAVKVHCLSPCRLFDRKLANPMPIPKPESRLRYRIETLVGITGARMSKYRDTWAQAIFPIFNVVWRPHLLSILVFEGLLFGFGIGINVSSCLVIIVRDRVTNSISGHQRGLPGHPKARRVWLRPICYRRCLWHSHRAFIDPWCYQILLLILMKRRSLSSSASSSAAISTTGS